jgi:hypothetical protein
MSTKTITNRAELKAHCLRINPRLTEYLFEWVFPLEYEGLCNERIRTDAGFVDRVIGVLGVPVTMVGGGWV